MRGLVLTSVALLLTSLSGCVTGSSSDRFFPPARDLPDGLTPISTDSSEWKLAAPFLGMQSNPGRVSALDTLPKQDLGGVATVEAYLLQGTHADNYGVMVLSYNTTTDVGAYFQQGESQVCDNKDMAHVLKDNLVYVFIGGDGSTAAGKAIIDHLADAVQLRSGATLLC